MKELLNKKFGPFDGKTWAIVIVAGVGIGLFIRKRAVKDSVTEPVDGGSVYYDDATTSPGVRFGGGTQYNEGSLISAIKAELEPQFGAVWEAIESQKVPPKTTDPTVMVGGLTNDNKPIVLRDRYERPTSSALSGRPSKGLRYG